MDKTQKLMLLVKVSNVITVITALTIIGCIIYSIVNKEWFYALGLCGMFIALIGPSLPSAIGWINSKK